MVAYWVVQWVASKVVQKAVQKAATRVDEMVVKRVDWTAESRVVQMVA